VSPLVMQVHIGHRGLCVQAEWQTQQAGKNPGLFHP